MAFWMGPLPVTQAWTANPRAANMPSLALRTYIANTDNEAVRGRRKECNAEALHSSKATIKQAISSCMTTKVNQEVNIILTATYVLY